jgi:AraC family transcriptional regulator
MRLERAAWHLRTTNTSVAEIAQDAGFSDQPAFTRAFRNAYGAPPGQFRTAGLPAHEIPSLTEIHFSPYPPFYRIDLPELDNLTMNIEFVTLEPRQYVYLRHHGPYPEIGATFQRMAAIAGPAGLIGRPDALFVGVYHDDPGSTPAEDLKSDAGVTVDNGIAAPASLELGELPAGRYAKGIHKGSYATMGDSWGKFMAAIDESGCKLRTVSPFELYISDMDTTPEDELITELYAAVE